MQAELHARLEQLDEDLRSGRIDRAALFWLKVFADSSAPGGVLRSDAWVDAGLAVARDVPGLAAAALEPRQDLVVRSGLFRFVRMLRMTPSSAARRYVAWIGSANIA